LIDSTLHACLPTVLLACLPAGVVAVLIALITNDYCSIHQLLDRLSDVMPLHFFLFPGSNRFAPTDRPCSSRPPPPRSPRNGPHISAPNAPAHTDQHPPTCRHPRLSTSSPSLSPLDAVGTQPVPHSQLHPPIDACPPSERPPSENNPSLAIPDQPSRTGSIVSAPRMSPFQIGQLGSASTARPPQIDPLGPVPSDQPLG